MKVKKVYKTGIDMYTSEYYYPGKICLFIDNGNLRLDGWILINEKPVYLHNIEFDNFKLPDDWEARLSNDSLCIGFKESFSDTFLHNLIEGHNFELTLFKSKCDDNMMYSKGFSYFKFDLLSYFLSKESIDTLSIDLSNLIHSNLKINSNEFSFDISDYTSLKINTNTTYIDKSIGAKLNGNIEVGFFIHVEDGYLRKIEGYTFSEDWPEEIDSVEFFEIENM